MKNCNVFLYVTPIVAMHILSEDDAGVALWIDLVDECHARWEKRVDSTTYTIDRIESLLEEKDVVVVKEEPEIASEPVPSPPAKDTKHRMEKNLSAAPVKRSFSITSASGSSAAPLLVTMVKKIMCNTDE